MKASQAGKLSQRGIASRRLHKPACSRLGMKYGPHQLRLRLITEREA